MKNYLNKLKIPPHIFSYLVLGICLIMTISVWSIVKNRLEAQTKATFDHKTDNITQLIVDRVNLYISSLYGIQGLFSASEEVTRAEFVKYTNSANIFSRFPGISSFGYLPRVNKKDIKALEKKASLELTTKLATATAYKIYPESNQEEYYPLLYISPLSKDKQIAFGFDYLSEINRKTTLETARDQNQAVATAKIILKTTQKPAFLIVIPVYKNNVSIDTLEDRRKNISGIIVGSFRPENLFSKLLENTSEETGIDFEVFDGCDQTNLTDDRLLFDLDNGKYSRNEKYQPRFTNIKSISIASRPWTIKFYSLPDFETNYLTDKLPIIVLLSGFDLSLLLFLILHLINTTNDRAIKLSQKIISEYKTHDKLHSHIRVEPIEIKKPKPETKIDIK